MPLQLSASLNLTGSINLNGNITSNQTLTVTSSNSVNSISASYINANNISGTVTSASYSLSSSFAPTNTNITASWSSNAITASYVNISGSNAFVLQGNSFGTTATIGTNDAQSLALKTNNSTKITITSAGSVGIGTNNPTSTLNVVSNANSIVRLKGGSSINLGSAYYIEKAGSTSLLTAYGDTAAINGGVTDQSVSIWTDTSIPYLFYIGGSEKIRIDSNGNFGIGTNNPAYLLDVNGNARIGTNGTAHGRLTVIKDTSGATLNISYASISSGYGEILMTNSVDPTGTIGYTSFIRSYSDPTTDYSSTLTFGTNTSESRAPIERMRIANNGNVGLGTTSPTSLLHIKGGTQLLNSSGSTDSSTSASLMIIGQNTKGGSTYHDFLYISNTVVGAVNPNKFFRLNSIGNIEIINSSYGTNIFSLSDSGSLQLPVAQAANVTQLRNTGGGLKIGNNGLLFDDGNVHFHSTGVGQNIWLNCSGSGMFIVNAQTGASGGMCIGTATQKGYVTIVGSVNAAITQPYGYLISSGAGSTTGTSPNPYSLTCDNRIMSSEFNVPSDERLKDIKGEISLNKAIDLVTKITPIEFTWKDGVDVGLKAGYSAQQTYKAGFEHLLGIVNRPGLEATTDNDGFTNPKDAQFVMNYEQVIPYHSKLIKHLLDKIEQLEAKIVSLENKIAP